MTAEQKAELEGVKVSALAVLGLLDGMANGNDMTKWLLRGSHVATGTVIAVKNSLARFEVNEIY